MKVFKLGGKVLWKRLLIWSLAKYAIDFVPEHGGVFDGPIPIMARSLLGMNFNRFNMETGRIEWFDIQAKDASIREVQVSSEFNWKNAWRVGVRLRTVRRC